MPLQPDRPDAGDQEQGQIFLPEKDWISSVEEWKVVVLTQDELESKLADRKARDRILSRLLAIFTGLVAATMAIFILQGFKAWKFELKDPVLEWLGGATVAEVAGLLTIAVKGLFRTDQAGHSSGKDADHRKK